MELEYFFEPIKDVNYDDETIGSAVIKNCYDVDELSISGIILIGLPDNDGSYLSTNSIRESFYKLYNHFTNVLIYDLGNLRVGETYNDFQFVLNDILDTLYQQGRAIIFLNKYSELLNGLLEYHKSKNCKYLQLTNVDSILMTSQRCRSITDFKNLQIANIGSQIYLNPMSSTDYYMDKKYDIYRLADLRTDIESIEPCLRDSDIVRIDIESVRAADAPGQKNINPNGLYADEICRVARYAGISDKTSLFILSYENIGINEYCENLLAQILWHICAGVFSRTDDYPVADLEEYIKYTVLVDEYNTDLVFYESQKSGRWWFEIQVDTYKYVFACSRKDYEQACRNELPDRYLEEISRLKTK